MSGGHGTRRSGEVVVEHVGSVCASGSRGADRMDAERDGGREQQRGRLLRGGRSKVQVRGGVSNGSKHHAIVGAIRERHGRDGGWSGAGEGSRGICGVSGGKHDGILRECGGTWSAWSDVHAARTEGAESTSGGFERRWRDVWCWWAGV